MWTKVWVAATAVGLLAACEEGGSSSSTGTPAVRDSKEYDQLAADLEADRELAIDGAAQDFQATGARLTWIDAGAGNPVLRTLDDETGDELRYELPPYWPGSPGSPTDNINYSASSRVVASMNTMDSLRAWDPRTGEELGELVVPAPPYGQKWWAYGADGGDVYVAVEEAAGMTIRRWTPGDETSRKVAVIDDLIAPNDLGEFLNFAVSGDRLIFYEGGRLWSASLSGGKAKWAQNDEYVGDVEFSEDEIVYTQGGRIFRYDVGSDSREEFTDRIAGAYTLNGTYGQIHLPTSDAELTLLGGEVVYVGSYGLFAFDPGSDEVRPVLLNARDNSTIYRTPTAVPGTGALFAKGLESTSGAVGADGPTWRVGR
jgi:hypothetical protein